MTSPTRELRATSDALRRDLEAIGMLEDEKRSLSFDDPRLPDLARRIEEIAARILDRTSVQSDLTDAVAERGGPGTIESTHRLPAEILAEWREFERRASDAEPGSPEATEIGLLIRQVRSEYREAYDTRTSSSASPAGDPPPG